MKGKKDMRERLKNKKGFTLAELLIVVAIVAILIAIMVPVFGTARANAVQAKAAANVRSAYAEAVTEAMTADTYTGGNLTVTLYEDKINTEGATWGMNNTTHKIEVTVTGASKNPVTIDVDSDVTVDIQPTAGP